MGKTKSDLRLASDNIQVEQSQSLIQTLLSILSVFYDFGFLALYSLALYLEAFFRLFVSPSQKSLSGEVILITGTANGIGKEICMQLVAEQNVTLVCWDIDRKKNEKLVQDLKDIGLRAFGYEIDISDQTQVALCAAKVRKEVGDVTMVINNAGIMPVHQFLDHNPKELTRVFEVNVFAHFWILREFLPKMVEMDKGHIVTVCSAAGLIPVRNLSPYCGTKHAVHGYLEALKDEFRNMPKRPNIKFTTVYPFTVKTNLIQDAKCSSRFPSLVPILEPSFVAKKLIEGVQRNYEHVYIPPFIQFVGTFGKALLPKVQAAGADVFKCYVEPVQLKND